MSTSLIDQVSLVVVDAKPDDYLHLLPTMEGEGVCPHFYRRGDDLLQSGTPEATVCWLINHQLPDMPGLELCELLRPRLTQATTFILVDEYDAMAEMEVLMSGLGQFACKPIHSAWLRDAARWHLRYRRPLRSRIRVQRSA
jgi:DNA-binding response OmpR family regulator